MRELAAAIGRAIVYGLFGLLAGAVMGFVVGSITSLFCDGNASQTIADAVFFGAFTWAAPFAVMGFLDAEQKLMTPRAPGKAAAGPNKAIAWRGMKRLAAELFGTFALVFAGTGAIVINEVSNGAVSHVGIALTFGLVVLAMIYAVGDVSGAHLNPSVTTGFFLARRFPGRWVLPYILSQCAGALLASALLHELFPDSATLGATLPAGVPRQSFLLEVVLTLLLMFVILSVSTGSQEKGIMAGVAVGSVIAFEALFAGPISGASMNPARSLAPALVSGRLEYLWIYLAAPLLGAAGAVLVCRCVHDKSCCSGLAEESCS